MFSFPEAARCLSTELVYPNLACLAAGACIDTRIIEPGDLFVALPGGCDNGHHYLEDAFRKGASGALVEKAYFKEIEPQLNKQKKLFQNLLPVVDTPSAFLKLAAWHRQKFDITYVGITGSVGKTSTKEFLTYLLRKKSPVLASKGNFNNHLGLPLTLFRLQGLDRFCVAELGANKKGDIEQLAEVLKPSAAILTPISEAHLEGFGSLETIYDTKLELLDGLPVGAPAVISSEDSEVIERSKDFNLSTIKVGRTGPADFRLSEVRTRSERVYFTINDNKTFSFPGSAGFLALNAAMAVAMVNALGIALDEIPENWDDFKQVSGRFEEQLLSNGVKVIFDGYNANPLSFQKALEAFQVLEASGKKVVVLSDMLELGMSERRFHEDLGHFIADCQFDYVLGYGYRSKFTIDKLRAENPEVRAEHFEGVDLVAAALADYLSSGDVVFMKASRGMRIENVLKGLQQKLQSS